MGGNQREVVGQCGADSERREAQGGGKGRERGRTTTNSEMYCRHDALLVWESWRNKGSRGGRGGRPTCWRRPGILILTPYRHFPAIEMPRTTYGGIPVDSGLGATSAREALVSAPAPEGVAELIDAMAVAAMVDEDACATGPAALSVDVDTTTLIVRRSRRLIHTPTLRSPTVRATPDHADFF